MFVFHSVAFQCVSQECCCVSLQFHKKLLVWHWCDTWAKHGMRWIIRRGQQFCGRTNTSYVSDVWGYNLHIQALVCMCKGNAETLFLFCVGKTVTLDKQDKTSNPLKNYWKCCWYSMHGGKEKSQQSSVRKVGVYSKWKNWSFIYRRDTAVLWLCILVYWVYACTALWLQWRQCNSFEWGFSAGKRMGIWCTFSFCFSWRCFFFLRGSYVPIHPSIFSEHCLVFCKIFVPFAMMFAQSKNDKPQGQSRKKTFFFLGMCSLTERTDLFEGFHQLQQNQKLDEAQE